MRTDLSVKHWLNIVCILVLVPFSNLAISSYSKLDPPAALALIDENGHAEIPDTYTSISADAFKDSDLVSVVIPETITSIGDGAFKNSQIVEIDLPNSVTHIGANAFASTPLTSISMPESLASIGYMAFADSNIQSLTIPDSLTGIPNIFGAWYEHGRLNIKTLVIGDSITSISELQFYDLSTLESLTLGQNISSIGQSAFTDSGITSLVIPDSVITINSYAFLRSGITNLQIGNSVEYIGREAFAEGNLTSVIIPDSVEYLGPDAFRGNDGLKSVVIGNSITAIPADSFRGFELDYVVIGNSVESIGDDAFNGVNGDVFILKPAQENFDIYNFTSMANVYACDTLDEAGVPQGCEDAWPDDGIEVPEWPINVCDSDPSLTECDPCTIEPESCDPCAYDPDSCEDPCALTDSCNDVDTSSDNGSTAIAEFSEAFGGNTIGEGGVYTFPSGAEGWAGFANMNTDMYPLRFTESGSITFNGSVADGGSTNVRFRLEYNPHPDVNPAYDAAEVTVSGSTPTSYTVAIPSQGSNTFSSLIMYVVERDVAVTITDVVVDGEIAVSEPEPAAQVNVTFQVDMSAVETNADGVYLAGGGVFGQDGLLMTDNGSDVWSVTAQLDANTQVLYKFRNQPSFGTWDGFEDVAGLVAGGCNTGDYNDRFVDVGEADITLPVVAYGSCTSDVFVPEPAPGAIVLAVGDVIDFETDVAIESFGGAEAFVADGIVEVIKYEGAEIWAGSVITAGKYIFPIDEAQSVVSADVFSTVSANMRMIIQPQGDHYLGIELDVLHEGNGWQTLTWDFKEVNGPNGFGHMVDISSVSNLDTLVMMPNFGVYGEGNTYQYDNFTFGGGTASVDVPGCTDSAATNYNAYATSDDGNCTFPVSGDDSAGIFSEAFGGTTIGEGGVYIFPSSAEVWAGFANMNDGIYPLIFPEAGSITFNGSLADGGSADVRFRLEYNPYPDVDPAYNTATVTVSGATPTSYTVAIPSQGANTFSSLIMYLETRDVAVTITDVVVSSDADNVDSATPNNQIIKVANTPKGILGKTAVLEVSYDTSDSNNQLTGHGMRIHFNSNLLSFKEITNLVEQDIIVNGQGPFNDEDDFDNDPLTDQYISFGWASLFGNWPNMELPAVLMNIAFDVSDAIDTDITSETSINFTSTALASGYQFESESYNLELQAATWDFDGNGQADALSDGLMMLRYCFGLRDEMVTASAMATGSPMSSEQVVAEIEAAMDIADIDADGELNALTDGLLLLRYLFGLRDDILTNGAVGPDATRSSNSDIQNYLESHMPAI